MLTFIKKMLQPHCPQCKQPLQSEHDPVVTVKSCPHGHYREESYYHLGVRIEYKDE